ncbi:MAG: hypothetical protein J5J06_08865 [Phycisphaerae bacterium]|nr:hypothetical protein [Phycisphaerae bacterium]
MSLLESAAARTHIEQSVHVVAAWISPGQLGLLGVLIVALTILMMITRRRIQTHTGLPGPNARELYQSRNAHADASRREVEEAILELDRVARQVHGQLDTRFARLEALIRAADERIQKLDRAMNADGHAPALDVVVDGPEGDPNHAAPSANAAPDSHAEIHRLADQGLSAAEIAHREERPVGEIELILALRKARSTDPLGVR